MFTLRVKNLRGLRDLQWHIGGTTLLVGPNGSGKTTALLVLRLLHTAYDRGLASAVSTVLGGSYNLRHLAASEGEPVQISVEVGESLWTISLIPRGTTVDFKTDESLVVNGETILLRDSLGNFNYRGKPLNSDERLGIRTAIDTQEDPHPGLACVVALFQSLTVFHEPDLWALRTNGSPTAQSHHLHSRGQNAFTLLRKWNETRGERAKFKFVVEGLKASFPSLVEDLEFEASAQSISLRIFEPGQETPIPTAHLPNGLLAMTVLLTQVANVPHGGLVAIDEPENALHPWAIREFYRRASSWTEAIGAALVLVTHSPVLLNQLNSEPERIHIMQRGAEVVPVPLTELRDPEWLRAFSVGDLYTQDEFASNIG